jgi:MFS transporter, CP family, cyanate transporter
MGLAAAAAFAGAAGAGLPAWARYVAVLLFSMLGGMIPATLFSLAVRLAPSEATISSTVGWVQQWSACGQFVGPPLVAWIASRMGGWHWTWVATGAVSLLGLLLSRLLARAA